MEKIKSISVKLDELAIAPELDFGDRVSDLIDRYTIVRNEFKRLGAENSSLIHDQANEWSRCSSILRRAENLVDIVLSDDAADPETRIAARGVRAEIFRIRVERGLQSLAEKI